MTTKEERLDILDKLASGKLSVADAAAMLNPEEKAPESTIKVEEERPAAKAAIDTTMHHSGNGKKPSWLHIQVNDLNTGKRRVSVNIPLRLMKFGLKLGSRFSSELEGLDVDELTSAMADMESGLLVDVQDETDGEHVQIFVD